MPTTKNLYLDGVNGSYSQTRKLRNTSTGLTAATPSNTYNTVPTANLYSDPWPSRGGVSGLGTQRSSAPLPTTAADFVGFELDSSEMDGLHLESGSALSLSVTTNTSNAFQGYLYALLLIRRGDTWIQQVGSMVSPLTSFNGADTFTMTGSQILSQQFLPGDRLYIHFYLYFATTENTTTTFTINEGGGQVLQITTLTHAEYQAAYAPPNDDWASAIALTGTSGQQNRSNYRCSYEAGEPIPPIGNTEFGNIDGTGSVWYKWTAPADGSVHRFYADTIISTSNSRVFSNLIINTRLKVYTGDAVDNLTAVVYNDNYQPYSDNAFYTPDSNMSPKKCSQVEFDPEPGVTYYFQLCTQSYNYSGSSTDSWSGTLRFTWSTVGRDCWVTPDPITDISRTQDGTGPWNSNHSTVGTNGTYHPQSIKPWAGAWELWQSFGSPSPHNISGAWECCTAHARHGDQSNSQYGFNNPDAGGWTSAGYGWVSADSAPGGYCAPLYGEEDWRALGYPGNATAGSGICTGGDGAGSPPFPMVGGDLTVECVWTVLGLNPAVVARETQFWQYQGTLPPGVTDVIYEKEHCDIISVRVRPASGYGTHNYTPEHPQDTAIWWQVPDLYDEPGFGFFWDPANNPEVWSYKNSDPSKFLGQALDFRPTDGYRPQPVGTVLGTSGVLSPSTEWWDLNGLETVSNEADNDLRYWFVCVAGWIMAGQSIDYQGGASPFSRVRRFDSLDLEVEIVLQPPRYAFLYAGAVNDCEDPNLGVVPDKQLVHFQPPRPTGLPDVVVSQVQ